MQNRGFEEERTVYETKDPRRIVGQVRRWGPAGPAYEVLGIDNAGNAECEVVCSGEQVICSIAEVLEDPMADTIP